MKKLCRLLALVVILLVLISSVLSVSAVTYDYNKKTQSDSVLLINMDTGTPIVEINANKQRCPASLTKIMTYIVVAENVSDYKGTRVPIKQEILDTLIGTGSSVAGISAYVGKTMSVYDLLNCMMISSGNDAAAVLGDYIGGGDTSKFVDMMNAKAKELGCNDTNFANPHGLDHEDQYSTAYDIYRMAEYALTLPHFSDITNTTTYYCEDAEYPLTTTNYMIDPNRGGEFYYRYAKGIKTGTTDGAGRCIVTTAFDDGYAYMCVCMGAPYEDASKNAAMVDAKELLRWALLELELTRMITVETPVCEVDVNFGTTEEAALLYPSETVKAILPKSHAPEDVTVETNVPDAIDAPLKKGDIVGTCTVYYKGEAINTVDLVVAQDIEKSEFAYVMYMLKVVLTSPWFWLAAIIAVILIIVYIIFVSNVRGAKKQKRVKRYRKL